VLRRGGAPPCCASSEAWEDPLRGRSNDLIARGSAPPMLSRIAPATHPPTCRVVCAMPASHRSGLAIAMSCCAAAQGPSPAVSIDISLHGGLPELGSTRLKAGTILSTGVMGQLGKAYGNRMWIVAVTKHQARRPVPAQSSRTSPEWTGSGAGLTAAAGGSVKTALLMAAMGRIGR